ncbi:hypothetical protein C2W62_40215 [Candidatus Entotheonella serta]|nr:hypothetical protein C2W62_40215 [Candidatus Entotheonella serta]
MSQDEFAKYFGISKRTVQDWEQRRRTPSGPSRADSLNVNGIVNTL